MPVRKIFAIVISIAIFGAIALVVRILYAEEDNRVICEPDDYECNFDSYMDGISRRPPDFSAAPALAIETPRAISQNLDKVISLPDYESTSMLRVIIEYPNAIQNEICDSEDRMNRLRAREEAIESSYQRQEFSRLLSEIECR